MRPSYLLLIAVIALSTSAHAGTATATFAGGCFWCMESVYQEQAGVISVESGFTGGTLKKPTYAGNHQGHFEAVQIVYDPNTVNYEELLEMFWRNIDPFDNQGQFCDKGPSYRSAIFVADDRERELAQDSLSEVAARFSNQEVHTEIRDANEFWPVEEYHQDYYLKNPARYRFYRWNCGRDQRLKEIWGEEAGGKAKD